MVVNSIKRIVLVLISLCSASLMNAQNESRHWLFGSNCWLDFSSGSPVVVAGSAMNVNEGCAAFSDTSGNLLFYTNGINCWAANHTVMPNGSGLFGHNSATQSAIVVPRPGGNYRYFFLFTIDADTGANGLQYNEIDMLANGGLGDIIVKNQPLVTPVTEKVTAVRHANNIDFWIVTHKWNSNEFYSYLVTASGVNTVPVVSAVGMVHDAALFPTNPNIATHGYLKASVDGNKIAYAISTPQGRAELFDFNPSTGILSNPVTFNTGNVAGFNTPYGIEFSPDSKLLYVGISSNPGKVMQFDLQAANIPASMQLVGTLAGGVVQALQLANNGKIYVASLNDNELSVIDKPDIMGVGCNFIADTISLGAGTCRAGLPNFFVSLFLNADYTYVDTCLNASTQFTVSPVNPDSVFWNFDDPASGAANNSTAFNPQHVFSNAGTFDVQCIAFQNNLIDTVVKTVTIVAPPAVNLGPDLSFCDSFPPFWLDQSTLNADSYLWSDLTTNDSLYITTDGIYWLQATTNGCSFRDSIVIDVLPTVTVTLGNDTSLCNGDLLVLDADNSPAAYLWNDGSTTETITVDTTGIFIVTVTVANTCPWSDTIAVTYNAPPNFSLGADQSSCNSFSPFWLDQSSLNADDYLWSDLTTNDSLYITTDGIYWLQATVAGCSFRDSITVEVTQGIVVSLGNDTTFCSNNAITLNAGSAASDYYWNTGALTQTITVNTSGTYIVSVDSLNNCIEGDTIIITVDPVPVISFASDTTICEGAIYYVNLDNGAGAFSYQWSDGFPDAERFITDEGVYTATVTIGNCSTTKTLNLHTLTEPFVYLGEDTVLCLGGSFILDGTYESSSYLWQDGSTNSTLATNNSGAYAVVVTNQCGVTLDSIHLEYVDCNCNVFLPNAFTPNLDTKNETYNFKYDCLQFTSHLRIFNRWGTLLFESEFPETGWDGKFKSKDAVSDVYIYELKYSGIINGVLGEKEKRGTFLLLR